LAYWHIGEWWQGKALHYKAVRLSELANHGVPEKYFAENFLGRGQTNEITLKGFARKFFLL